MFTRTLLLPLGTFAALALAAPMLRAQDGFPTKPPADLPVRPYQLPKPETRTLPNGLKIVVTESHRVPIVTMRLALQAGSSFDPQDQPGLAAAVAAQMSAGTQKYDSLHLRQAAENLGGTLGVSAGQDFATLSASGLAENFAPLAALMTEVLLHPTFPENELSLYKGLTLQGLVLQRQNPGFLAGEQIAKILYGTHPYAVTSTTVPAVQGLTRDKLEGFYKRRYTPAGSVLVVVGDIKPADVFSTLEKTLGIWSGTQENGASQAFPAPPSRDARRIYLIDRPASVQSNIVLGNLAIKRGDPDTYALTLANAILGAGSGSRLFANVREKLGYAYDVHSSVSPGLLAGDFTESAQTRTDVTAPALKEMLKEAERIRSEPVSEQELQDAKNYVTGSFALSLTSQAGLADRLLTNEIYHLPPDYITTYRDKISAITIADIHRVAQKYIMADKEAIIVVGDAGKVRDSLKEIAPIQDTR